MKLEIGADASGLPLGTAATVSEYQLAMPALDDVSVPIPESTPVIADRGHDSDELRDDINDQGFEPLIPHRRGRVRPNRNDGRRLRRYSHQRVIERLNAWLHRYRGLAVRHRDAQCHRALATSPVRGNRIAPPDLAAISIVPISVPAQDHNMSVSSPRRPSPMYASPSTTSPPYNEHTNSTSTVAEGVKSTIQ